jgi:hypothetical protein
VPLPPVDPCPIGTDHQFNLNETGFLEIDRTFVFPAGVGNILSETQQEVKTFRVDFSKNPRIEIDVELDIIDYETVVSQRNNVTGTLELNYFGTSARFIEHVNFPIFPISPFRRQVGRNPANTGTSFARIDILPLQANKIILETESVSPGSSTSGTVTFQRSSMAYVNNSVSPNILYNADPPATIISFQNLVYNCETFFTLEMRLFGQVEQTTTGPFVNVDPVIHAKYNYDIKTIYP